RIYSNSNRFKYWFWRHTQLGKIAAISLAPEGKHGQRCFKLAICMQKQAIRTAIILARGLGTRMRQRELTPDINQVQSEAADRGVQAMIPLTRTVLDFVLSALADAGYEEVCLVIGPEHDILRHRYTKLAPPQRVRIGFAIQAEARGTADALLAAEKEAHDEEFL